MQIELARDARVRGQVREHFWLSKLMIFVSLLLFMFVVLMVVVVVVVLLSRSVHD